jgi:tetratricopeptide (TPR) repeat protein
LVVAAVLLIPPLYSSPIAAQDPEGDEAALLTTRATESMANDRWEEAVTFWSQLVRADNTNVVGYLNRALSYERLSECQNRDQDAQWALTLVNSDSVGRWTELERIVYRAQAFRRMGDLEQAIQLLRDVRESYPDYRPGEILLNQVLRQQTDYVPCQEPR